jgi:hypothetical protein
LPRQLSFRGTARLSYIIWALISSCNTNNMLSLARMKFSTLSCLSGPFNLIRSRSRDLKAKFDAVAGDSAATWRLTRTVLHHNQGPIHSDDDCRALAIGFNSFFNDKLHKIQQCVASSLQALPGPIFTPRCYDGPVLSSFTPVSSSEVRRILQTRLPKSLPLDCLPSTLLHATVTVLASVIDGRMQFVKMGRHTSNTVTCHTGVPQGSGPLPFTAYISPVADIIQSFGINYHQFADDTQLYVRLNSATTSVVIDQLTACTTAVRRWFLTSGLLLNADKSEVVILETNHQLHLVGSTVQTVNVAVNVLPVTRQLKSLGILFDAHLNYELQANAVVRDCTYHLRALRQIRHVLPDDVAKQIGCSMVCAKLDYCNALLHGALAVAIDKLQRVQNQLARIVTSPGRREAAMPILQSLHWLPVRQRIDYKLALITYKARTTSTPAHLASVLQLNDTERVLRSSAAPTLFVPRTRTEFGKRAFSVSAPLIWNSLPVAVRTSDSVSSFKRRLKTHLFSLAFPTIS